MNIKEINKQIQGDKIHVKAFPGAKSTQLNHHATSTLGEYSYDAAIIHVGINNIQRSVGKWEVRFKSEHWKNINISNTSINKNKY